MSCFLAFDNGVLTFFCKPQRMTHFSVQCSTYQTHIQMTIHTSCQGLHYCTAGWPCLSATLLCGLVLTRR